MTTAIPSISELRHLQDTIRQQAPELEPTLMYLFDAVRCLSELSLDSILAIPENQELNLETFRKVVVRGTLPEDLSLLCRRRLAMTDSPRKRRRLLLLLRILERLLELEAKAKVERVLGLGGISQR